MSSAALSMRWPSARDFMEAVQSPGGCFFREDLRESQPAVDRLGMPLVATGQFAYVFKMKHPYSRVCAVRCFRSFLADRRERYRRISTHLAARPVNCLAGFEYDDEGILVASGIYPILVLEWVEGQTLDVFIEQVLRSPETIRNLADQWVKVVANLRSADVAHGDLQHGNILVHSLGLRLVDPDGIFVPGLSGWESCELGHRHYQHPRRDTHFFGPSLDNFSALVIYLSLITIAERPSLWARFHDENLLFKADDFRDPDGSELFREIRDISPEHRRLSEALQTACKNEPDSVPHLADLVSPKSKLPWWMLAPPSVEEKVRTREASIDMPASVPLRVSAHSAGSVIPTVIASTQRQGPGAGSGGTSGATQPARGRKPAAAAIANPFPTLSLYDQQEPGIIEKMASALESWVLERFKVSRIPWAGFAYALVVAYLGIFVSWLWFPILVLLYSALGANGASSETLASFTYLILCMVAGFTYAIHRDRKKNSGGVAAPPTKAAVPPPRQQLPPRLQMPKRTPPAPVLQRTSKPPLARVRILGNTFTFKYHTSVCRWSAGIFGPNERKFSSIEEAEAAGFQRCRACLP